MNRENIQLNFLPVILAMAMLASGCSQDKDVKTQIAIPKEKALDLNVDVLGELKEISENSLINSEFIETGTTGDVSISLKKSASIKDSPANNANRSTVNSENSSATSNSKRRKRRSATEAGKIRAHTDILRAERVDLENLTDNVLMRKIEEMRINNETGLNRALIEDGLLNLPAHTFDSKNKLALKFLPGMPDAADIDILEPSDDIEETQRNVLP